MDPGFFEAMFTFYPGEGYIYLVFILMASQLKKRKDKFTMSFSPLIIKFILLAPLYLVLSLG